MNDTIIETTKTRYVVCWKNIKVTFEPPINKINRLEVECSEFKPKKNKKRKTK